MFIDPGAYPFVRGLEEGWEEIREEYLRLAEQRWIAWPEAYLYENRQGVRQDRAWNIFPLYAFGKKFEENCRLCPQTTARIEAVPRLTTSIFTLLAPGTHVHPHTGFQGYSEGVLRCHLGLVVPPGCGIRVGKETGTWQEGHCLIFDDMNEHEVWNDDATPRAVLLVDFAVPEKLKNLKGPLVLRPEVIRQLEAFQAQMTSKSIQGDWNLEDIRRVL